MLRDWTGSDKVNLLTCQAERFFVRLIMKVDDYGCFYADSRLLKANLFPLLLDNIRDADILRWMAECQKAGLIVVYESSGKNYLQVVDFKQRLDRAKSKFPLPDGNELPAIVNDFPPEEKGSRKEVEGTNNDIFFQMFRRAAGKHITDEELTLEVAKFKNKYPNAHANRSGALINSWVARIGIEPSTKQTMVM